MLIEIEVLYSCGGCGVKDAAVKVRTRRADENVVEWIEGPVAHAISFNHSLRSPACRATHITETKIPMPAGDGRVGDPTAH